MKSKRHRFENTGVHTMMNDDLSESPADPTESGYAEAGQMQVDVGNAMPDAQLRNLPVLQTPMQAVMVEESADNSQAVSKLADGIHFVGHAILRGPCSIAGLVEGNLTQAPEALVSVVVTETGRVTGDITAQKISVMGHTNGTLDSGQGEVTLHDTARVQGLVRYRRIQVNGADLNATLERVAPAPTGA
jgi:cytoskeletal protein CcmA (bactofilin family)